MLDGLHEKDANAKEEYPLPAAIPDTPLPVAGIVLPGFREGAPASLEPCSPASAAVQLLAQGLNVAARPDCAVATLCALAEGAPAFELGYGDPEEAAELVARARDIACPPPSRPDLIGCTNRSS